MSYTLEWERQIKKLMGKYPSEPRVSGRSKCSVWINQLPLCSMHIWASLTRDMVTLLAARPSQQHHLWPSSDTFHSCTAEHTPAHILYSPASHHLIPSAPPGFVYLEQPKTQQIFYTSFTIQWQRRGHFCRQEFAPISMAANCYASKSVS